MRRFLRNVFLFLMPILLYYLILILPFYYAGYTTHEFMDADECIEMQRTDPGSLYGLGYSQQTLYYKTANVNYYTPEIIALGTSRVMQIKARYFESEFYNCGGVVNRNYNEYRDYLQSLSYDPDAILLGIDAWVFNSEWNKKNADSENFEEIIKPDINKYALSLKIRKDWKTKWGFDELDIYPNNIGFNGRIKDSGFMIDGSHYDGDVYRHPEEQPDYGFADTLNRIETGTVRFEWGNHIDEDTLIQLHNLLEYCKENDIYVIGFTAPFAPRIYVAMKESGNYGYLNEIGPACEEVFKEFDYELYNYLDVSDLKLTDECFLDGFHGSEVVYGYIVKDMCDKGSRISEYVDESDLSELLNNAYNGMTFFDPDNRPD